MLFRLELGFSGRAGYVEPSQNRDPWSVNSLAQLAGEFVLRDQAFRQKSVETITAWAQELYFALQTIPDLRPFAPAANYIMLESLRTSSVELQAELLKQKILIRDCGNYQGLNRCYVRVAVRTQAENQALIAACAGSRVKFAAKAAGDMLAYCSAGKEMPQPQLKRVAAFRRYDWRKSLPVD